jgi:prepilin-type N-terminal cleavage/methylation domain-containing protein
LNAARLVDCLSPALRFSRSRREPPAAARRRLSRARRRTAGFSLIELAVVVFIISVIAALGVPAFKRITLSTRSAAVINDLRVFANAFQSYAQDKGDWPAATGVPAEIPPGMQPYLAASNWQRPTPIGGAYTWAENSLQQGQRYRAVLIISNVDENKVTAERQQLADIDQKIDDGDLDTGNFRLGFRNQPIFVIEH